MNEQSEVATPNSSSDRRTTFGELCNLFGGEILTGPFGSQLHASDYSESGTPVIMPQDMADGRVVCDKIARVSNKHVAALSRHLVRKGDIVYSRRGDVSRFAVITDNEDGWLCGTGSIRIGTNSPDLSITYLRRYLQQDLVGDWLRHNAKGVTMPNLNTDIIRVLPLVYPPLPEQRRIAAILDQADALRAKRRAALAQLDEMARGIFAEMFGDPLTNSFKLMTGYLSDLGTLDRGVSKHRPRNDPLLLGGTYPFIQTGDVTNSGGYIDSCQSTYSEFGFRQSKLWPAGTLCITIAANIARVAILTFSGCFPDSVVGFIAPQACTVEYVRVWFGFVQQQIELSAPESTQKNINLAILRALRLPIPSLAARQQFYDRVVQLRQLKAQMVKASASTDALFASLQHRAFAGEL